MSMVSSCCCSCWAIIPNAKAPVSSRVPENVACSTRSSTRPRTSWAYARASAGGSSGSVGRSAWGARTRRRAGRSPGASAPARPRPRSAAGCVSLPPPGCWPPRPPVPRCWSVSWLISSQGLVRPGALYAGGLACLVEPVIGGAPVPADVAFREGGDRVLDLCRGGHAAQAGLGGLEALHADVADERVRGAVPGRPLPRAAAVPARPATGTGLVPEVTPAGRGRLLPEGFRGGHGLLRRGFVVEQRRDHRSGHDPAVVRLRVDDPVLQVAARPDRREQGGQVVGEVFHGRRPFARPAQPVAERQARRCRPRLAPRPAHAHDLGGQRVVHPYRAGIGVTVAPAAARQRRGYRVRGRPGAARVKPGPDGLAGRLPPGWPSLPQR